MKTLKQFIFTFILLFTTTLVFSQTNEYNVIPEPLHLKPDAGQFTFNEKTNLFLEKGVNKEVANAFFVLSEHLKTAGGIDLQSTTTGR